MTRLLDYMISSLPIRIEDLKVDPSLLRIQNLVIHQFGHLPGRTMRVDRATRAEWAFTYIVRGTGTYQASGGPLHRITPGSLFWEWPGTEFHYSPSGKGGWDEYYVIFSGSRVEEWLASGLVSPQTVYQIGVDSKWVHKMDTIGDLIESGLADNADRAALMVESLLYEFVCAHEGLKGSASLDRRHAYISQILDDLAGSLYQQWNERQLCERNHLSRSTLRRIVRQNTGYSLNEYVHRLKMTEAKKLLRGTNMQVKEISHSLGYDDIAYFSRIFKKYTGTTAAAFRAHGR